MAPPPPVVSADDSSLVAPGETVVPTKQRGKLFRRAPPDLKWDENAADDVPRSCADLVSEMRAPAVARFQVGLHADFGDGPAGVAAHDAEAVRPEPFERFFLPRRFDPVPLSRRRRRAFRGAPRRIVAAERHSGQPGVVVKTIVSATSAHNSSGLTENRIPTGNGNSLWAHGCARRLQVRRRELKSHQGR